MRTLGKWLVVAAAAALLADQAPAQRTGVSTSLVSLSAVQKDLELSKEQIAKVQKASEELLAKQTELLANRKDAKTEEAIKVVLEATQALAHDFNKKLAGILTPDQLKRLKQIELQQDGGLLEPEAQRALQLTEEQKKKIQTIFLDWSREILDVSKQEKGKDALARMKQLQKAAKEKALGVLTDDQKKAWQELIGKPLDLEGESPPRALPPFKREPLPKENPNKPDIYRTKPQKIEI